MTILQNEKYRVSTIYSVTNGEMPLKYGLELCKKCENSDGWYVICHIKYDERENWCDIQSVGTRMLDVPTDEWDDVKAILDVANRLIIVENQLQNS